MNYIKNYKIIMSMSAITFCVFANQDRFDVMENFSYPVAEVELMRHHVAQGLYFMEASEQGCKNYKRALDELEQADNASINQNHLSADDRETLQNLLNQLNGLIDRLEDNQYRSNLSLVCLNLQNKL